MVVMSMKASNKIFTFIASCSVVQAQGLSQYGHIMNLNVSKHCMIGKKTSKCLVTLSMNTSTKNLKFMASLSGGQALRRCQFDC